MRYGLRALVFTAVLALPAGMATAQDGRYVMQRAENGFVRLDTQTGQVSFCRQQDEQFVCRMSADDRQTLEAEIDELEDRIAELEAMVSNGGAPMTDGLPTEDEIDRTMGIMEDMMRRFLGVIDEFDRGRDDNPSDGSPDRT